MPDIDRSWLETLYTFMGKAIGEDSAHILRQKYQDKFSEDYRTIISPRYAFNDILQIERLLASKQDHADLISPYRHHPDYRLHFYSLHQRYLDEYIPVLENLGLRIVDQIQFNFGTADNATLIKSFTVKPANHQDISLKRLKKILLETIQAVISKKVENDGLNKLCLLTGMHWQDIDVLRTYRNYLLQLGHKTTSASIHHALVNNPTAAHGLFDYFEARFLPDPNWINPIVREEKALLPLRMALLRIIDQVSDINDDRILRTLFNLIDATVRTNFHGRRHREDYFVAIKINCIGVIDMPLPKPQYEIYVHSYDMEGIHLRAGKISRGGIRWSDRPDDFRFEILGLMQTQVNKNALIIPTGAKGGFIVKSNGTTTDPKEAGKRAYLRLMRGLLDLTDNYRNNTVVSPNGLIVHDDPDPYLVVAADKGTARFSDLANQVADETGFWLGNAFASGGSHGYDHKALGITARGAWECVKRHFRELGKDIQSEAFTVIGIGSMDGDVFGNGMLQSRCIRLLAAFSGQHIFLDPSPSETDAPYLERKRLFELPGSTWDDYNRNLISDGGGVYARSAKDIPVTPEVKKWLGIRYKSIDGESLIRRLLTAPVELLWLGGIGTYVKAGTEKQEEVGDRANENVRIDAGELAATVVGEGANLGFTQKARIEYALKGGRINTDAIDNSAGVDTSDHEVNLKILLDILHHQGIIDNYQKLFAEMTETVCTLVLADNIAQSFCLSLEQYRCRDNLGDFLQIADRLEAAGFLDRTAESFPQAKDLQSRENRLLTRPEIAVLIAAAKRYLTQQILSHSKQLQAEYYDEFLFAYFPVRLATQCRENLHKHPLADEIKATVISNRIINQAGCGFLRLLSINNDQACLAAINSYLAFNRILQLDALRNDITALDDKLDAAKQYEMLVYIERGVLECCRWLSANRQTIQPDENTIATYRTYLDLHSRYFTEHSAHPPIEERFAYFTHPPIPASVTRRLAIIGNMQHFPFIVQLAHQTGHPFEALLKCFDETQHLLKLNEIDCALSKIPSSDPWQNKVYDHLKTDILRLTGSIAVDILNAGYNTRCEYFDRPPLNQTLEQYRQLLQEVQAAPPYSLYPYLCLLRSLEQLNNGRIKPFMPQGSRL